MTHEPTGVPREHRRRAVARLGVGTARPARGGRSAGRPRSSPTDGSRRWTRQRPFAEAVAIRDGRVLARRRRRADVMAREGAGDARDRPRRPHRDPGPERLAHPPDPRRPQLQPRAALGRRAVARRTRCALLREQARAHAAAAVGARRRRLVASSSSRSGACRRSTEINAAAPDTPVFVLHLYDRALAQRAPRCAPSATRRTRPTRRAARSSATRTAIRPGC